MAEPLSKHRLDESPRYPEPSPTAGSPVNRTAAERELPPRLPGMPSAPDAGSAEFSGANGTTFDVERDEDFRTNRGSRGKNTAERARERLQVVAGSAKRQASHMADRASDVAHHAGERMSQWKDSAADRVSAMRDQFRERLPYWRRNARHSVRVAQARTREVTNRYPVQTVAAAAGVGFIIGFALRIWRSDRG